MIHETREGEEKAALRKTIAGSGTDLTCSSILSSLPSKSYSWTGDSILHFCDVLKLDDILGSWGRFPEKSYCSFRCCPNEGEGPAQILWHLFISSFLVNKGSHPVRKVQFF